MSLGPDGPVMDAVHEYCEASWHLFVLGAGKVPVANCPPCRDGCTTPEQKEECGCLRCHGFFAATTDPTRVAMMLAATPGGWLAARLGAPSGFVVIDVDRRHGGFESLAGLHLPATVAAITSGGVHLYFRHPGGYVGCRNGLRRGVDRKGDGGYCVIAPSPGYRWYGGRPPKVDQVPLLPAHVSLSAADEAPRQVPGLVATGATWSRSTVDGLVPVGVGHHPSPWQNAVPPRLANILRVVAEAEEGERNARTFWAACRLGSAYARGGLGEDGLHVGVRALIALAGDTGLHPGSVLRTVRSGVQTGARDPFRGEDY